MGAADAVFLLAAVVAIVLTYSLYVVPEGHVGCCWWGGRLMDSVLTPGLQWTVPVLQHCANVPVAVQTHVVDNVACDTKGGLLVQFERIEVVTRMNASHVLPTVKEYGLEYNQLWIVGGVRHEITRFCAARSLRQVLIDDFVGLEITLNAALQRSCYPARIEVIAVRATKPRAPESIRKEFERLEAEEAGLLLLQKQMETDALERQLAAKTAKAVRLVELETEVKESEGRRRMQKINDDIMLNTAKARADTARYDAEKQFNIVGGVVGSAFLLLVVLSGLARCVGVGDRVDGAGNLPRLK